jgi:hypothetical protein
LPEPEQRGTEILTHFSRWSPILTFAISFSLGLFSLF